METYSFGEWLKQRREQLRQTRPEVAAEAYCSVVMLKKIEADERRPSSELAESLAGALRIPEADQTVFVQVARGERPVDALWHVNNKPTAPIVQFNAPQPLPIPATPFVGRATELDAISERLSNRDCRLLTLLGPGGMGKTRLALATAQGQQSNFTDGVAFVPLVSVTDSALIPDVVAPSLRLTVSGQSAEQVLAYLSRRSMLIVLDNCEQLEGDLHWLSRLLEHATGVKLLATSRERLHLKEEWVYIVPGLIESDTLFVNGAKRINQDFNPGDQRVDISGICRLVDNLPLAVELAASWTPVMPCRQIAEHIQRDISLLATDARNIPERHRSVQAVFDHSWELLPPAEQNALMRLSMFRGGWQPDVAQQVADADLLLLRRLVNKSLVRAGEDGRYDLHELIRQYAPQKLSESGEEHDSQQRHFDAYVALVKRLDVRQQAGSNSIEVLPVFDQEQDNIRAALDWALEAGDTQSAVELISHLGYYWFRRGVFQEGRQWMKRAINQPGDQESTDFCIVLSYLAVFSYLLSLYSEAQPLIVRAFEMAQRLESDEAYFLASFGYYNYMSTNAEQALRGINELLALAEETGKILNILPLSYVGAGTWYQSSGQYAEAYASYQKAIDMFRGHGALDMICFPLGLMGEVALRQGNLNDALDLTLESLDAANVTGHDVAFNAWGQARLGQIQLYLGDLVAAEQNLQEALLLNEDARYEARGIQESLSMLSELALTRGNVNASVEYMEACLRQCEKIYDELKAGNKIVSSPDALPIDLMSLCARASLVSAAQGNHERAATLLSIADLTRKQSGQAMFPPLQKNLEKALADIRAYLPEEEFDSLWRKGQNMTITEIFEFLLA